MSERREEFSQDPEGEGVVGAEKPPKDPERPTFDEIAADLGTEPSPDAEPAEVGPDKVQLPTAEKEVNPPTAEEMAKGDVRAQIRETAEGGEVGDVSKVAKLERLLREASDI